MVGVCWGANNILQMPHFSFHDTLQMIVGSKGQINQLVRLGKVSLNFSKTSLPRMFSPIFEAKSQGPVCSDRLPPLADLATVWEEAGLSARQMV